VWGYGLLYPTSRATALAPPSLASGDALDARTQGSARHACRMREPHAVFDCDPLDPEGDALR